MPLKKDLLKEIEKLKQDKIELIMLLGMKDNTLIMKTHLQKYNELLKYSSKLYEETQDLTLSNKELKKEKLFLIEKLGQKNTNTMTDLDIKRLNGSRNALLKSHKNNRKIIPKLKKIVFDMITLYDASEPNYNMSNKLAEINKLIKAVE
tara:strand:- start:3598 stop:4044 length:447 start_codon:yes stop_codon:yes gene_type:complete